MDNDKNKTKVGRSALKKLFGLGRKPKSQIAADSQHEPAKEPQGTTMAVPTSDRANEGAKSQLGVQNKTQVVGPAAPLGATATIDSSKKAPPPPTKKRLPKIVFLPLILIPFLILIALLIRNFITSDSKGLGKKGEITWWGLREEALVMPLIKKYEESRPDVEITYIKQSTQDYRERLTNALAKGEGPDIIHFHNTWVPMYKNDLDILPDSVMSQQEFANTFYPIAVSNLTTDAGIVGIPLSYDAITLYINEDLFDLALKKPPESWDELKDLAREMTQRSGNEIIQSGAAMGITQNIDHWQETLGLMMIQNRANPAKPQGKLAEDALAFYALLAKEDNVWDVALPDSTIAFARGKVAMYFGPVYRANEIRKENPNLNFRTVLLPQLPKDNPSDPDISYATYWVEGVWNKSVNKDSAWDFLKFMSERESLQDKHQSAQNIGLFGEPYPRRDMALLLREDPVAGSVITLAPFAKGWFLVDDTHDGATGINSQIAEQYAIAISGVSSRKGAEKVTAPLVSGVAEVLAKYGIKVR